MEDEYWYFTFGANQEHAGHYVRIRGTFAEARAEMFARYGNRWAFQYSEQEWLDWCKEALRIGCRVETELE